MNTETLDAPPAPHQGMPGSPTPAECKKKMSEIYPSINKCIIRPKFYPGQEKIILGPFCRSGTDIGKIAGVVWEKFPRENLKPRDVPKANPRAQPKSLPLEYPEAFRFL